MTLLEKEIERKLKAMVDRNGGFCLKWTCPGWRGVPDRLLLFPGGRIVFVETKRPKGGKASPMQTWWSKKLVELGFAHFWIKDPEGIDALEDIINRKKNVWWRADK